MQRVASHISGRQRLAFRAVNRRSAPGYQPSLQRHHLLPCQLLDARCFGALFDAVGRRRIGFDDFRRNGMLLPAREEAAIRMALPLHRGPHRDYNAMVIERVGQIEGSWSALRQRRPECAREDALLRLSLLQTALRRRLLDEARPFLLNRHDPASREVDFSELDLMAEELWRST